MRDLLAKSYSGSAAGEKPPEFALLTVHSRDVPQAARALAEIAGGPALKAAGLIPAELPRFTRVLCACGWMQDIGKANSHFLEMLTVDRGRPQLLRHEAVSMLLLMRPEMQGWLHPIGKDAFVAIWAAGGHHRQFSQRTRPTECAEMVVYTSHPQFKAILGAMGADLGLGEPPSFERDLVISASGGDLTAPRALKLLKEDFGEAAEHYDTPLDRRFIGLVKAFGIAADVAASAIARQAEIPVSTYVRDELSAGCLTQTDLEDLVRTWALRNVDSPETFIPRPFQDAVADSSSTLTLAQAGCGSGKSLAAYLWAKRWAARYAAENRQSFRLFFCLPTTGTTTEHFKDYALEAGVDAALAHSRARIDRQTIALAATAAQEETSDSAAPTDETSTAHNTERQKIEALDLWSTPVVVTTSDTVLGLMANTLRALCSSPAILSGVIVFDEVHAFDDAMFGHLLVFLANFPNLPVLLMTASLQPSRRKALETGRPDLHVVPGPRDLEELPRYELARLGSRDDASEEIGSTLAQGGKVLWVVNRVDDANEIYRQYASSFPHAFVQVYHSRFRYEDRSRRHGEVIDAFKGTAPRGALLVATQVAEMSLDLSADLLVSDLAPIPALVQRMGRLNRRATPEKPGKPRRALITEVEKGRELPYHRQDLDTATAWLDELLMFGRPLNQRDLATVADAHQQIASFDLARAEREAVFFSGIWQTEVRRIRDEGYTISVILEADWKRWKSAGGAATPNRDWLRRNEVAIPIRDAVRGWTEKAAYLPVAPESDVSYCWDGETKQGTGAAWRRN